MMDINEAVHEGISWDSYDLYVLGAPVLYGTYDRSVLEFIAANQAQLEMRPASFFNVSVVARTPAKATVDYTNWDDVDAYGRHLLYLDGVPGASNVKPAGASRAASNS